MMTKYYEESLDTEPDNSDNRSRQHRAHRADNIQQTAFTMSEATMKPP